MSDIELVIKISEDAYKATCGGSMLPPDVENVVNAIKNGTPLPKGHGDLIDRSKLKVRYVGTDIGTDCPVYLLPTVDEAPTIIDAAKESEENK